MEDRQAAIDWRMFLATVIGVTGFVAYIVIDPKDWYAFMERMPSLPWQQRQAQIAHPAVYPSPVSDSSPVENEQDETRPNSQRDTTIAAVTSSVPILDSKSALEKVLAGITKADMEAFLQQNGWSRRSETLTLNEGLSSGDLWTAPGGGSYFFISIGMEASGSYEYGVALNSAYRATDTYGDVIPPGKSSRYVFIPATNPK